MKPALEELHRLYKSLYLLEDVSPDLGEELDLLEKITIQETGISPHEVIKFHCFYVGERVDVNKPESAQEHLEKAEKTYRFHTDHPKNLAKLIEDAKKRLENE